MNESVDSDEPFHANEPLLVIPSFHNDQDLFLHLHNNIADL